MATKTTKKPSTKAQAPVKLSDDPKEICFVIMPFGGWLDDYYITIYSPAIVAAGLDPHRADDLFRPSTIVNDIWAYTKKAKVLLADLTGKNPNVFYELGLAHALAKPAILIAESMDDIPFDLRALRIILYDKNAPDWGNILKSKIENSLKEVLVSPVEAVLPAFLDVRSAGTKPTVSSEQRDFIEIKQELELLRREIRSGDIDSHRFREKADIDIGPSAAIGLIRTLLDRGAPDDVIVRRVRPLGPPTGWIVKEIERARVELEQQAIEVAVKSRKIRAKTLPIKKPGARAASARPRAAGK